jgi:Cys-rich repeat protein
MKSLALPPCLALAALFVAPGAFAQSSPCSSTADCAAGAECVDGACVESRPAPTACTTDADCGDGQFCAIYPCAAPCDADDPACEPIECDGGGECVDETPPTPTCTADDDCGDGNVCLTGTVESCATSGCACPDDGDGDPSNDPPCDCGEPAPPECTTESYAYCGPRYLADCAVDADCGPGFVCVIHDGCDCAVDSAGNETCDCPTEPGTAPPGVCELIRVECADDADCDNGFVCVDEPQAEPCFVDDQGNTTCDVVAAARVCVPPDYAVGAPVAGESRGGAEDTGAADDVDDEDVVENAAPVFRFSCAQGSAGGALPLAALALLLRRRRR